MIKNARQYAAAKKQIRRLQEALELSKNHPVEMDRRIYDAMLAGIESQIKDIQVETDTYERLKNGRDITVDSLDHIGRLLIEARIASGLTQKKLAEITGIAEQQIQKYEDTEYKSAKLDRLVEVMYALGFDAFVELAEKGREFNKEEIFVSWDIDVIKEVSEVPVSEISSDSTLASLADVLSTPPWDFKEAA